jgi:DNA-binding CsgD family transcriptional regulator
MGMAETKHRHGKQRAPSNQAHRARQRLSQTAKEAQALAMRTAGASYEQIAQNMSFRAKSTA